MAFQKGQGGRTPGSKNKLTLAKAQARAEAMKTMNAEIGEDAFKGDGVEFLQMVYKNPKFDFEIRMEAATRAAPFEKPKKTESTVTEQKEYVVAMMPAPMPGDTPADQLEEWKRRYMRPNDQPTPEEVALEARFKAIAAAAAEAKRKDELLPPARSDSTAAMSPPANRQRC